MNPDFPYHKTTDYTTYTLTDGNGNTVSFKVRGNNKVDFTDLTGKTGTYLIHAARNFWNEYVRRGFNVVNKCLHHDMKKFHKACSEIEKDYEKMNLELASKAYHDTICKYEREYNYALEA